MKPTVFSLETAHQHPRRWKCEREGRRSRSVAHACRVVRDWCRNFRGEKSRSVTRRGSISQWGRMGRKPRIARVRAQGDRGESRHARWAAGINARGTRWWLQSKSVSSSHVYFVPERFLRGRGRAIDIGEEMRNVPLPYTEIFDTTIWPKRSNSAVE